MVRKKKKSSVQVSDSEHTCVCVFVVVTAGGMAASIGIGYPPFTIAQWRELERQAMIYKYLMASLPVPSHLLSCMI